MDRDGFRKALEETGYAEERIAGCLDGIAGFEAFLGAPERAKTLDRATEADVFAFAAKLIAEGRNERVRLIGLYRVGTFIGNHPMTIGAVELLGGYEMLGKVRERVAAVAGSDVRDRVFAGVELPALGTPPIEWAHAMATVLPRLEAEIDSQTIKRILDDGIRAFPEDAYLDFKKRLEESESLDAFLEDRRRRHLDMLRGYRDDGTLYYDQLVTDELIEFVEEHPEIGGGVRQGKTIIETKIPHRGEAYLATDDVRMKQYHVCHCPLAKESIPRGDVSVSPSICEICPSHNRKPWEIAYGRKLESDVLESALRGGLWCKFAIHLPEDALP